MIVNSIEVNMLYYSDEGREVSFTSLLNNDDVLDEKHYTAPAFWNISGGFEVTVNGYITIFHSCNFYCLLKATDFLIHSLYWMKGKRSAWFDTDAKFPDVVAINPTPSTVLRIQKADETNILFSYMPVDTDNYTYKRGDRYFAGITISAASWFQQTDFALSEYFQMLKLVIANSDQPGKLVATMNEYVEVWQKISEA